VHARACVCVRARACVCSCLLRIYAKMQFIIYKGKVFLQTYIATVFMYACALNTCVYMYMYLCECMYAYFFLIFAVQNASF